MSSSTPTSIQPGWYEDPQAPGMLRWFDGMAWSPFTRSHAAVTGQTAVPHPRTAPPAAASAPPSAAPPSAPGAGPVSAPATRAPQAVAGADGRTVAAARAALLAADSGPVPIVPAPAPAPPAPPTPTQAVARARPAPVPVRAVVTPTTTTATDRFAASVTATWPPAPAAPAATPTAASSAGTPERAKPEPAAARGPTGLRQLVGRWAEHLPAWLPVAVTGPLSLRMVRYATRTDRFRDHLTAAGLTRLVFPEETAWEASVAACLGVVTIALSVWPVAGFGAWLVTCAFAGLALRHLRREVLLGGAERAWFAVACGVGPLWTGLLALAFR